MPHSPTSPVLASPPPDLPVQDLSAPDLPAPDLIEQGRQAYGAQRFIDAVAAWSQAAALFRAQSDPLGQALALSYLTAAYQQLGQWEAAQSNLAQSLDFLPAEPASPLAQQVSAQVYNTQGSLYFALGQTQAALETWQIAADLYTQVGDESRYFNNLLNQIQAQQALGYYHQARNTLGILEDRLPEQDLALQIRGYQRLGHTYRLIGDLAASQTHLQTALGLVQPQAASPILLELGNTAQAQGEPSQALTFYQQAIEKAGNNPIQVSAQLNQLQLLAQTDPVAARGAIASLYPALTTLPEGRSQIYAYIHAAQSLLQLGAPIDLETAADLLAQAIQLSLNLQDQRAEAYARGYLGHAYERSQQWAEAQTLTEQALMIAELIKATDITYQWQWQLGRLLKQQNHPEAALKAYRTAYSTLQSLKQDLVAINQDLQFSFRDSVEPVYRELVDLLLTPDTRAKQQQPHQARVKEAREVIESLQVAELDNFFRTACLEAQQVALEEVEKTAAAVIYPIILPDRLEIILSQPGQPLQQFTTGVAQPKLEQTLLEWRQNLEKPFTTPEGKALGQALYSWLIQPMQPALVEAEIQTLVFVLDGALRNAPMAALYDGERYLVEQYALSLSPGLQLLGPRPIQDTPITALLAGLTQPRHGFSALLNVKDELQTVHNLVRSRLLLDEAFTTHSLIQQVTGSERPIVHLATHGQFSSNAEETFILAWDRPIPVNELSALLSAGDLNRTEPIELLILNACETATGDKRAALGLAGVALQSGTR
ncbi:MAG: CHAT domain-containing protein, partial [Cyanobacteria bacterium P01_F01_bin.4]